MAKLFADDPRVRFFIGDFEINVGYIERWTVSIMLFMQRLQKLCPKQNTTPSSALKQTLMVT